MRRIVRSGSSSSRYGPSLDRPSGRHFTVKVAAAAQLQSQAKVPSLPALARAEHFRLYLAAPEVAGGWCSGHSGGVSR